MKNITFLLQKFKYFISYILTLTQMTTNHRSVELFHLLFRINTFLIEIINLGFGLVTLR